ncbi:MAG: RnfABCDGE type electron transport complex subunit D [Clostridiaceae bacterium]|nr:RnfABCDGE type electron transport complex subunit D [Clostridiaceae bacterium]
MVSSSPHIRSNTTTQKLMLDVVIALIPASVAAVWFFGIRAAILIITTVISSVLFEYIIRRVLKRSNTIGDLSAVVTGLLLALNLPPALPVWMAIVGSFFAIVVVKQLFGGIGQNFVNPALAARAMLIVSYGSQMTSWTVPFTKASGSSDLVSSATPLEILKSGGEMPHLFDMFIGRVGGSLGEMSAVALIIGGVYLLVRRVISWHIPAIYCSTVFVLAWILGSNGAITLYPLYHILSGGLLLGAIFMATDYTTSPMTKKGKVIYAFGCGFLTIVFRLYTNMPEGVSYAILLMNVAVPLIDRYTKPKRFGGGANV